MPMPKHILVGYDFPAEFEWLDTGPRFECCSSVLEEWWSQEQQFWTQVDLDLDPLWKLNSGKRLIPAFDEDKR